MVMSRMADTFFCRQQRVKRHVCFIMSGLCTPFTVFAAIPAFGIDDGTSVELVSHEVAGDLIRRGLPYPERQPVLLLVLR